MSESRWTKEHIDKTYEIIQRAKANKPAHIKFLDKAVYWVILFFAIVGNFVISIPLILFLFVLSPWQIYLVIVLLAGGFGFLIEILIRDIEHLEMRHHVGFGLVIPIIAVVNVFFITNVVNQLKVVGKFNPLVVGLVYAIAFILPYVYYKFYKK
ncbi:MAG: hypothetical protein QF632_02380 [Candidatus Woesearchaeota archaeon]|nr:hypothetical protein [Candidatus Woesearchaeota archaeon]